MSAGAIPACGTSNFFDKEKTNMKTDWNAIYPSNEFKATVSIRGSKDELIRVSLMLDQIVPESSEDYDLFAVIKEELDSAIIWLREMENKKD